MTNKVAFIKEKVDTNCCYYSGQYVKVEGINNALNNKLVPQGHSYAARADLNYLT